MGNGVNVGAVIVGVGTSGVAVADAVGMGTAVCVAVGGGTVLVGMGDGWETAVFVMVGVGVSAALHEIRNKTAVRLSRKCFILSLHFGMGECITAVLWCQDGKRPLGL